MRCPGNVKAMALGPGVESQLTPASQFPIGPVMTRRWRLLGSGVTSIECQPPQPPNAQHSAIITASHTLLSSHHFTLLSSHHIKILSSHHFQLREKLLAQHGINDDTAEETFKVWTGPT